MSNEDEASKERTEAEKKNLLAPIELTPYKRIRNHVIALLAATGILLATDKIQGNQRPDQVVIPRTPASFQLAIDDPRTDISTLQNCWIRKQVNNPKPVDQLTQAEVKPVQVKIRRGEQNEIVDVAVIPIDENGFPQPGFIDYVPINELLVGRLTEASIADDPGNP